jgi:hypothetical protein
MRLQIALLLLAFLTSQSRRRFRPPRSASAALAGKLRVRKDGPSPPHAFTLAYSWDVNGDGVFGDATSIQTRLTWTQCGPR